MRNNFLLLIYHSYTLIMNNICLRFRFFIFFSCCIFANLLTIAQPKKLGLPTISVYLKYIPDNKSTIDDISIYYNTYYPFFEIIQFNLPLSKFNPPCS